MTRAAAIAIATAIGLAMSSACRESEPADAPRPAGEQGGESPGTGESSSPGETPGASSGAGESLPSDVSIPTTPAERIDRAGVDNLFKAGRFHFAGQPDEEALVALLEEEGVRTVVNVRDPGEQSGMGMNERGIVEEHSARYESIPVSRSTFSKADVDRFAAIIESSPGPILVHCASSNRVGGLWAAYLATHHGVPIDDAIELGRSAGMRESMEEPVRKVAEETGGG